MLKETLRADLSQLILKSINEVAKSNVTPEGHLLSTVQ